MGLAAIALVDPEPALDICVVWPAREAAPTAHSFLSCLEAAGPFAHHD
jgi:hypothetical protein